MKKWMIASITSAVVIPSLVVGWQFLIQPWAQAETVSKNRELIQKQIENEQTLTRLYEEQRDANVRQDVEMKAQREITNAQIEALKYIVEELKK